MKNNLLLMISFLLVITLSGCSHTKDPKAKTTTTTTKSSQLERPTKPEITYLGGNEFRIVNQSETNYDIELVSYEVKEADTWRFMEETNFSYLESMAERQAAKKEPTEVPQTKSLLVWETHVNASCDDIYTNHFTIDPQNDYRISTYFVPLLPNSSGNNLPLEKVVTEIKAEN